MLLLTYYFNHIIIIIIQCTTIIVIPHFIYILCHNRLIKSYLKREERLTFVLFWAGSDPNLPSRLQLLRLSKKIKRQINNPNHSSKTFFLEPNYINAAKLLQTKKLYRIFSRRII